MICYRIIIDDEVLFCAFVFLRTLLNKILLRHNGRLLGPVCALGNVFLH